MRVALAVAGVLAVASPAFAGGGLQPLPPSRDYERAAWSVARNGHHARPEVIRAIQMVARVWRHDHPEGPIIRVNDLSLRQGGPYVHGGKRRHETHRAGRDADIVTAPYNVCHVSWHDKKNLTVELALLFKRYGATRILFNGDEARRKLRPFMVEVENHHHHFHVDFDASDRIPRDILPADEKRGVRPLAPRKEVPKEKDEDPRPDSDEPAGEHDDGENEPDDDEDGLPAPEAPVLDASKPGAGPASGPAAGAVEPGPRRGRGMMDVLGGLSEEPATKTATAAKTTPASRPIRPGDTLWAIARRHGLSWQELYAYDGGTGIPNSKRLRSGDPDRIYPGEVILVPPSRTTRAGRGSGTPAGP